ncbi:hypothetical protein GCM10007216_14550 [Thalassobacillus devorans]|uniref:Capsular polysaccharide biosynthesis protein n=2 Tax=Thalassobacillus devorans TaxID=279813 RepID=A0ABQ1NVJ3_9BACI|nr:sialyltransferase [Thalassobacillus devorans]NIK28603.1 hypothetical protein [Thalassobacillus devorans]GGC84951.1 hypothetical protein GCM10007216_14550 [Thalassobacillus devorans]
MKKKLDLKFVCKKIWKLEKDMNLLDINIQGVKFWQVIRYLVINEIIQERGIHGIAHSKKSTIANKSKAIPMYIYNSITKNPFTYKGNIDVLIFDHERKKKINNNYKDIYTIDLIKKLKQRNKRYLVIEDDYLRKHYSHRHDDNRMYNDFYYLSSMIKRLYLKIRLNGEEHKLINDLNKEIKVNLGSEINLIEITKKEIKTFKMKYSYYLKLLRKLKPKMIYVVVSYGRPALIAAAKELEIKVIEIQHGVITPFHLGYSFPIVPNHKIDYFPDELHLFGEYWKNSADFPINDNNIRSVGFPYLYNELLDYSQKEKKPKQIIFLSQGTIGKELSEFSFGMAKEMKDYNFIYKLHPGEYDRWKELYPFLLKANNLRNFIVIDNNNKSLHEYLSTSNCQIGVYSTAIYEGLALKCKTFLLNIPGIEYMENLIENGYAKVINKDQYNIQEDILRYSKFSELNNIFDGEK